MKMSLKGWLKLMNTKQKGRIFEKRTVKLLKNIGFTNIQFSRPNDSYDIIANKNNEKYFIEVRYVDTGSFSLNDKVRNLLKIKKNKQILLVLWSKNGYVIKSLDQLIKEKGEPIPRNRIPRNYKDSVLINFFGTTPNLLILNFFLDNRTDYSKKEIIEALGMSKTTFYKVWRQLEKFKAVLPTRRYGKAQLFKLNETNAVVKKLMILDFALIKQSIPRQVEEKVNMTRKLIEA